MTYLVVALLLVAVGGSLAGVILLRLARYRREDDAQGSTPARYDAAHYAPMARLLDTKDLEFLRSKQGVTSRMVADFRRDRRRIFRMYLQELTSDFNRLHAQARQLVATAPAEQSDLVGDLMTQQVRFWQALAGIEVQLALDAVGARNVNPQRLFETVNNLNFAIGKALPGPMLA